MLVLHVCSKSGWLARLVAKLLASLGVGQQDNGARFGNTIFKIWEHEMCLATTKATLTRVSVCQATWQSLTVTSRLRVEYVLCGSMCSVHCKLSCFQAQSCCCQAQVEINTCPCNHNQGMQLSQPLTFMPVTSELERASVVQAPCFSALSELSTNLICLNTCDMPNACRDNIKTWFKYRDFMHATAQSNKHEVSKIWRHGVLSSVT